MSDHVERAKEFSRQLSEVYGEDLVAVGLYGSAARGQYREGESDLNILVILRELDVAHLRKAARLAAEWAAAGNPPPLMFSEAEWMGSADVFPLEYADIAEAHLVLHGRDPFAEVNVRWEHLRHMCEHEIKARKISLREHYLLSVESPEQLGALLTGSVSTFVAIFRAMLRLGGTVPPRAPEDVVTAVGERVGMDAEPFLRVLRARGEGSAFAPGGDDPVVEGFLAGVGRASDWVDSLERPAENPTAPD